MINPKELTKEQLYHHVASQYKMIWSLWRAGHSKKTIQGYIKLTFGWGQKVKDEGILFMLSKLVVKLERLFGKRKGTQ